MERAAPSLPPVPAPHTVQWTVVSGYWCIAAVAVKRQYDTAATFALAEDNKMGITKLAPTRLRLLASNGASSSAGPNSVSAAGGRDGDLRIGHLRRGGQRHGLANRGLDLLSPTEHHQQRNLRSHRPRWLHLRCGTAQGHERHHGCGITLARASFTEVEFAVRRPATPPPAGTTVSDCTIQHRLPRSIPTPTMPRRG